MAELRQLRAFVAVAEELNFTRAAGRLFLRQQAVSKSVQQLESELGVALLERTTREVWLTSAGEELLRRGREVLAAADAAFEAAQRVGRGTEGAIRLGVSPAVGPAERETLVRQLRDRTPEVTVNLREVWPEQVVPLLRDRGLDVVVARTAPAAPEVDSAALAPTPSQLYVPDDHPLAARSDPVALAELDGERLLTWSRPGTPLTDLLLSRLAARGARVTPVEARILGTGAALTSLVELRALAIGPAGWPHDRRVVELALAEDVALPLLVLWPTGVRSVAAERLRAAVGTDGRPASRERTAPREPHAGPRGSALG